MAKPRIPPIAINVQDREKVAEYYARTPSIEEKARGSNGTIYLSDGFVGLALNPKHPLGIRHFGFQVDSVKVIEESAQTTA